jgi:hypothetical protein
MRAHVRVGSGSTDSALQRNVRYTPNIVTNADMAMETA